MQSRRRAPGAAIAFLFAVAACAGRGGTGEPTEPQSIQDGLVADLRGARLVVDVPSSVEAGQAVTFAVTLENHRTEPLQNEWNSCFAYVWIEVQRPMEPVGRTDWTGREAAFKTFALANATQGGGAPATDPEQIEPISSDCVGSDGLTRPMPPGRVITATFVWRADFVGGLPIPPRAATFTVSAPIYKGHGDVTPPPPPTMPPGGGPFIPGHWFPEMDNLTVKGTIDITGTAKPMAGMGEVIDGALADPQFLDYIRSKPFENCTVNLLLSDNGGTYLPHGPGWDLEVICDNPRDFIRVEVDPWTAAVVGVDRCKDPCSR